MAATGGGVPILRGNISKELADKLKGRSGAEQEQTNNNSLISGKPTPPPIAKKPQGFNPIHAQKMPVQQQSPIINAKPTPPAVAKKPIGFNPMSAQRTPIRPFNNDISKELNAKLKIQNPSTIPTGGIKLPHQIMRQSDDQMQAPNLSRNSSRQEEPIQYDKDGIPISNSPALDHSAARAKLSVTPKKSRKASRHLSLEIESIIDGMDASDEGHQKELPFRSPTSNQSEAKLPDRPSVRVPSTVNTPKNVDKSVNMRNKSKGSVGNSESPAKEEANLTSRIEIEDGTEFYC